MDSWKFMDYISPVGRNVIQDWYDRLLMRERADFDAFIRILAKTAEWKYPDFRWLQGKKYRGIGEIRFDSEKKAHRVVGYFSLTSHQYVMLIGCFHKQRVYTPANALDTAVQRKKLLEQGRGGIHERKI
jgi:phage-related protein